MNKGQIFLLTGKVASGKTTFARERAKADKTVFLSLDELHLRLFGPNPTREQLDSTFDGAMSYQLTVAKQFLDNGVDVYLDWGLWKRSERIAYREHLIERGYKVRVIYFKVPLATRLEWNQIRNQGADAASFKIAAHDLEHFDTLYEAPLEGEYDDLVAPGS